MNARAKKTILLVLAAALLFCSGQFEKALDRDRAALGLTISESLEDAPPLLALTTQALGGFRGLISNFLWIRSNDLQLNDQFFEAAQLANWITDLEPHYAQVWAYQGWNMAWNISVKFKDYPDRWRWVRNGMELLRDRGLRYNPDNTLIYQQLGWIFQNKMGEYLDDANRYYKDQWAREMTPFFGPNGTNIDILIHPQTAQERTNAFVLVNQYKIDPVFAKQVNDQWGPLDWRLPEAHAIYWASLGLRQAKEHPDKVTQSDLIQLRRVIYQSMAQAFQHGQIIANPFTTNYEVGPNLAIITKANDAYLSMMHDDPNSAEHMGIGHRNFLLDAVYYFYEDNRVADAQKWYEYLGQMYPDKTVLPGKADSFPKDVPLDVYAIARVQGDVTDTSPDTTTASVEYLLVQSYESLAIGQYNRYAGFALLAHKVYNNYTGKIAKYDSDKNRVGLPPFNTINKLVLNNLLDPQHGLPFAARQIIRTQIGWPAETAASTNAVAPESLSSPTNAPATNSISQ